MERCMHYVYNMYYVYVVHYREVFKYKNDLEGKRLQTTLYIKNSKND